jgi:hypothetical protein
MLTRRSFLRNLLALASTPVIAKVLPLAGVVAVPEAVLAAPAAPILLAHRSSAALILTSISQQIEYDEIDVTTILSSCKSFTQGLRRARIELEFLVPEEGFDPTKSLHVLGQPYQHERMILECNMNEPMRGRLVINDELELPAEIIANKDLLATAFTWQ